MTDPTKAKIDWGKLSSDSDADESDTELEHVPPTTGEQPAAESKETGEVAAEAAHKEAKGPPTIVPFKESKHIRPKMKIKGGFRPEKLEKKKNTIRTAKNPFDLVGDSNSEEEQHEASSDEHQASDNEQAEKKPEATEGKQTQKSEDQQAEAAEQQKPKQQPPKVFKPKEKKKKDETQLKEEAELDAIFNFIEGKGPKPKPKEGAAATPEKKEADEGAATEGKDDAAKKKKKKKKESKPEDKLEEKTAPAGEVKPAETAPVQQATISIEELMKKKAKETKAPAGKKKSVNVDVARKEMEERAAKAKTKKVHEDL